MTGRDNATIFCIVARDAGEEEAGDGMTGPKANVEPL